jgi:hypothetical protein
MFPGARYLSPSGLFSQPRILGSFSKVSRHCTGASIVNFGMFDEEGRIVCFSKRILVRHSGGRSSFGDSVAMLGVAATVVVAAVVRTTPASAASLS